MFAAQAGTANGRALTGIRTKAARSSCRLPGTWPWKIQRLCSLLESVGWYAEVGSQDLGRGMGNPVGQEQRIELAGFAVIEANDELTFIGSQPLQ